MIYVNILLITVIVVFIVDLSGIVPTFRDWFNRVTRREEDARIRPFDCSMCMTFWAGLIYVILSGPSIPAVATVCLCAWLAQFVADVLFTIREAAGALLESLLLKSDRHNNRERKVEDETEDD